MSQTAKILIALFFGAVIGLFLNLTSPEAFEIFNTYLFSPLGTIFINLIKMLVVPLVLFSIILGVVGLGDPKKLGRIGAKTIGYFLVTSAISLTIAISLALIVKPGAGGGFDLSVIQSDDGQKFAQLDSPPFMETLLNIIPTNPIEAMATGNMLQIIVFAVLVGFALTFLGEKTKGIRSFVEQGNEIMMFLVKIVMKTAPYGTFGLIAKAVGSQGFEAFQAMGLYFVVVLAALFIHSVVTYGGTVLIFARKSPIWFFKNFFPAMTVAFSTSSSNATLPLAMETAQKRLGVSKSASSFVQPLGATINMDGTGIMQGVATVFIAQVFGIDLTLGQIITVILTAVLASIGTAGVPGVGLVMLAMVLSSVGLPAEGIALIIGIDRLLDMTRTAVNISGDAACAVFVSETEKRRMQKEQQAVYNAETETA